MTDDKFARARLAEARFGAAEIYNAYNKTVFAKESELLRNISRLIQGFVERVAREHQGG